MSDLHYCHKGLHAMIFTGFMMNQMLKINLSIAIVDMIKPNTSINYTLKPLKYFNHWTIEQKNSILSSFYWGWLVSNVISPKITQIFGAKKTTETCMFLASILTIFTPAACYFNFFAVLILRVVLGFLVGVTFPAILYLGTAWFPPKERSKFLSKTLTGAYFGTAFTLQLSGYILGYLSWSSVFYLTGFLGVVWTTSWFYLIYDSPAKHPKLPPGVRAKITMEYLVDKPEVPWGKILTSTKVWAAITAYSVKSYSDNMLGNQLPSYLKDVLEFDDMRQNGLVSSLPFVGSFAVAFGVVYFDEQTKIRKTAQRKLFEITGTLAGFSVALLGIWENQSKFVLLTLIFAVSINGATNAGHVISILDIAPNFTVEIFALANSFAALTGWLSTKTLTLVPNNRWIFWIIGGVHLFGGVVFFAFGSGEEQSWNRGETNTDIELKSLNHEEKL